MTHGIIYYATGKKYYKQAEKSAKSVKKHNEIPITIFTNRFSRDAPKESIFDNIITIEHNDYPFLDRIRYFKQTPYEKSIYLDTDTIVSGDITPIFHMLDRFDIVARIDPFRNTAGKHWGTHQAKIDVPEAFPEYQCGVLGFRNTKIIKELFDDWKTRYSEVVDKDLIDQPFFRESVYHSRARIGTLPSEYNLLVDNLNSLQQKAKIFHFNGNYSDKYRFPVLGSETKCEVMDEINSQYPKRRTVYPGKWGNTRILSEPAPTIPLRIYRAIDRHGFAATVKKGIERII